MTEPTRSPSYRFGTFELQPNERRLLAGGEPVVLGPRAFDLLIALVERPGQLVTKEELLDCVWPKLVVEENNLQVQVSALRKILGQEARAVGEHIKRLKIPVGRVLASPYCRTMETARLAFGKAQPMQEARGGPARTDDPKRYDGLRKLLASQPSPGTNTVISSHGNPFHAVAGPPYLAEGEIAVVRSQGDSAFAVVGRIRLQDWELLQ